MTSTQYCHAGYLEYGNLPESLAEQTEILLVLRTENHTYPLKRKPLALTPTSKPAKKQFLVDQTVFSPILVKGQNL